MDPFFEQLIDSRAALMRAARAKLRNAHWAEDAVSETLLAALERRPPFEDPARVSAWLFGILRHKVIDQLRRHLPDEAPEALAEQPDSNPMRDPVRRASDAQFVAALMQQLETLPAAQARAFVMSEGLDMESADICSELGVSTGNLWVMLHRARHRLRGGLVSFSLR